MNAAEDDVDEIGSGEDVRHDIADIQNIDLRIVRRPDQSHYIAIAACICAHFQSATARMRTELGSTYPRLRLFIKAVRKLVYRLARIDTKDWALSPTALEFMKQITSLWYNSRVFEADYSWDSYSKVAELLDKSCKLLLLFTDFGEPVDYMRISPNEIAIFRKWKELFEASRSSFVAVSYVQGSEVPWHVPGIFTSLDMPVTAHRKSPLVPDGSSQGESAKTSSLSSTFATPLGGSSPHTGLPTGEILLDAPKYSLNDSLAQEIEPGEASTKSSRSRATWGEDETNIDEVEPPDFENSAASQSGSPSLEAHKKDFSAWQDTMAKMNRLQHKRKFTIVRLVQLSQPCTVDTALIPNPTVSGSSL